MRLRRRGYAARCASGSARCNNRVLPLVPYEQPQGAAASLAQYWTMRRTTLIAAAGLLLAACSSPSGPDMRWAVPENISYAAALDVDLSQMHRTESGLYMQDLVVGTGPAAVAGNTVSVHYNLWLPDGTLLESSHDRQPLQFMLGVGLVIRGWDEGLVGMQVGGRRKLVVRPSLAYGRKGKGNIPPMTTLVFDVEMVQIQR